MIKKSLLLMLLMALLVPWAANAQETLTVCDGTDNNSYVPFYGLYADTQGAASECVIPSNLLEDMNGGQITAMKFYIKQAAGAAWTGTHQVYLGEVDATTLTGITGPSAFTVVKTASFDATGTELTIEFDEPYTYEGGNLLIGTYVSVAGNWKSAYFYGVTQTENTGWYRGSASATGSAVKFLPKTTFTYEAAASDCPKPESLVASDVTAHSATLTWEGESSNGFILEWKKASESEWNSLTFNPYAHSYNVGGLDADTEYEARVQRSCGWDESSSEEILSDYRTVTFTTTVACFAPTNLTVEANAQTATFTWVSEVGSYQIAHATDATADPNDNIVGTATDTVYSMSDLTIDTDHYFWVRSNCGSEGYSSWAGPVSVHIGYCVPNPTSHDGKGITGVSFGTGDYVVTNGDGSASLPASAPYYGDYSSMIGAVQAGVESTIAITTGTNSYPYTFVIWVDFDNSLSFEDSEIVYVGKASSGNGTLNAAITIPATQELGDYRMRIYGADSYFTSFYNNGNPDYTKPHDPCSSGSYRHAHDYTLRVLEAPSCLAPTGLTVSDVTAHNATISWTSDAEAWEIQLDEEEAIEVTEATYTFTGLTAETTYSVKVRTNCGGTYSDWTNPVSFTTTIACPVPTVAVGSITAFTAEVSCTNTAAEYFNVMLGEEVVAENVAMPYTLTELTDNTSYTVKVQAICGGEDGESEWSSGTSFMTAEICPEGMVCIGQGTNTNSYVPTYSYYKYSLTEQIYTAEEIGGAGLIESVDFYCSGSITRNLNVYMVSTEKDVFESTTDWIAVTPDNLVFSGSFTTTANDWTTITFETPFLYDGTTNVAIIVDDNTGSYVSSPNFYVFNAQGYQTLRVYSDGTNYDPEAPSQYTGTQMNVKNRVRIAISEPPACPRPTHVAVNYEGDTTATVTWEGDATSYDIEVNASGTVIADVTSPYTLEGLELGTTYAVMVRANCGEDLSDWTNPVSFTTDLCMLEDMCEITFALTDSYGDGWNGAYIEVLDVATGASLGQMSNQNIAKGDPETETYTLAVCDGREIQFVWHSGSYDSECSYVVSGINGEIFSGSGAMSEPVTYTVSCTVNPCRVPTDLAASEISTFKADLSWTGYHDAYNLQYRHPAAADPNATTATVILTAGDVWGDGSGYQMLLDADATAYGTIIPETVSGYGYISTDGTIGGSTGDVASSVYDEFEYKIPVNADGALATENIVINDTITIEIPAGTYDWCITNPTSGDRMWIASSNGNVGGRYDDFVFEAGLTYEFTVSSYGSGDAVNLAITPMVDWILVENLTDPSYELTGLDAKTMYEWQVQGISDDCENGVTEWSAISSFFTEKAYYWNDPQTWTNDSVPAAYEDVTIPANTMVVIPSGYPAYANEISFEEGASIYIEEGGQLYHSNEIPVALQMNVDGYGRDNSGYYLIAAPAYTNANFSIPVDSTNLNTGAFDLYAFDQNYQGAEWRNYKAGEFDALTLGQGYLYANSENINIVFDGQTTPTNADVEVDLVYNGTVTFSGWNLVGNPFTCIAYVRNRSFYTLDRTGTEVILTTSNSVQPMEGIFVIADSLEVNPVATFTTTEPQPSAKLTLNLSQGRGIVDRASILFSEGNMLPKVQLNPNHTKVYFPMDGKNYAVVRSEEVGELPVNFKAETNGTYNLSFTTEEISFNYLHLLDNMTGNDIDLLVTPSYTFEASTTDYANRFKLVFATDILSVSENFAFFSNDNLIISNDGKATVQVIDINGRILSSETINGSASINVNGAAGVYMIRLINGENVRVQKVVVR